ncbi:MAG: T9SS type A sorting domain-containing protein [Crocinitomix sp.]|nr:T9SS type A sorting domain-containing protein [Crocinitomix sp.]
MKFFLLTVLTFICSIMGISQELSFEELGSAPAYCRVYGYQSGNGNVYSSATGGTPDYSYLWENLGTGDFSTNATWGGLNPGSYKITITDAIGATISETITLDSLNVIADFTMFSDDLSGIPGGFIGFAPDTLGFINLSENFGNPIIEPWSDPRFFWNFNNPEGDWLITEEYEPTIFKGYLYGGEFDVCLVAQNKNGCKDTICKIVGLFGSMLGVDENAQNGVFTIAPKANNNEIVITTGGIQDALRMNLYSLSGQFIQTEQILNPSTSIPFNFANGIYLYEFADKSGQIISSGKFNY